MRHRSRSIQLFILFLLMQIPFAGPLSAQLSLTPKKPEITYDRYEVKHLGADKADVDFIFIVNNPYPFGLDGLFMDYELFLKDQSAAQGKDAKFSVKANAKSEIRLPVEVNYIKAFKTAELLAQALISGQKTIPFTLNTVSRVTVLSIKFSIPVTAKGDLPLPELKVSPF